MCKSKCYQKHFKLHSSVSLGFLAAFCKRGCRNCLLHILLPCLTKKRLYKSEEMERLRNPNGEKMTETGIRFGIG